MKKPSAKLSSLAYQTASNVPRSGEGGEGKSGPRLSPPSSQPSFVLFAADLVGLQICSEILGDSALKLVVTVPSDPGGYNRQIRAKCAEEGVRCIEFEAGELSQCKAELRAMAADYFILAWWPRKLAEEELRLARIGVLNTHPSLLPWCRGKHPNFWALIEAVPFGVTIHWAVERLDAGEIAFQREIKVLPHYTGWDLHQLAQKQMVELWVEAWPEIRIGQIPRLRNDLAAGSYHDSCEIEEASRIDLDGVYSGRRLLNILRARNFSHHYGAWFEEAGRRYQLEVSIKEIEVGKAEPPLANHSLRGDLRNGGGGEGNADAHPSPLATRPYSNVPRSSEVGEGKAATHPSPRASNLSP
jgi:methionyl-tRNA formyltransferase